MDVYCICLNQTTCHLQYEEFCYYFPLETNFTPGKVLFNIHTFFLGLTSLILLFKDRGDSLQFLRDHSKMTSPKNSYFRAPSPLLLLVTNVSNALPPLLLKNNKLSLEKPPVSCMFITQ